MKNSDPHNIRLIRAKLLYSYSQFVYHRLTKNERAQYRKSIKSFKTNGNLTVQDMKNLLKLSSVVKKDFLYWKNQAIEHDIYYQTLLKFINQKPDPNPKIHDESFFNHIPDFLRS